MLNLQYHKRLPCPRTTEDSSVHQIQLTNTQAWSSHYHYNDKHDDTLSDLGRRRRRLHDRLSRSSASWPSTSTWSPPSATSKTSFVHQLSENIMPYGREILIAAMSTSNNEAPIGDDEVCWHYLRGECAHSNEFTCWHCAEFDLDEICFHYLSGECANNDECAHLHPAELHPAFIPLLAIFPMEIPSPIEGQGECASIHYCNITKQVTFKYQGGASFILPIPYAFSRRVPHTPTSINADGQPTITHPHNYQKCWSQYSARADTRLPEQVDTAPGSLQPPTKKRRLEVDDQVPPVGEPYSASADEDVDMVDQFAKTTLDSEPTGG
jgi:hypothetical protein